MPNQGGYSSLVQVVNKRNIFCWKIMKSREWSKWI